MVVNMYLWKIHVTVSSFLELGIQIVLQKEDETELNKLKKKIERKIEWEWIEKEGT